MTPSPGGRRTVGSVGTAPGALPPQRRGALELGFIESALPAAVAGKAVAVLNDQVDGLSTDANVEKFALANSFMSQEEAEKGNGTATR